jgi:hypothetical protein
MPVLEHEFGDDFRALTELAEDFTQLVAGFEDGDHPRVDLQRVVELAMRCMPRGQYAAVVAGTDGLLHTFAASSPVHATIDRIRETVGNDPASDAIEANDVVVSDYLPDDPRWPVFGPRVADATGFTSVVTYRLYLGAGHRAALCFYSDWSQAFDDLAIATGSIFAAYASLALVHEVLIGEPVPPARSRAVHTEIGVAVGILMAGTGLGTSAAYRRLHDASRRLRRSLPETARYVVEHRGLPPGPAPL